MQRKLTLYPPILVLRLPAPHLRSGSGRWDLGALQQGPGTQHLLCCWCAESALNQELRLICSRLYFQVVEDVTEFYKQTYNNYKDTRQEALKESLRLIHFGVRTQTNKQTNKHLFTCLFALFCCVYFHFHVHHSLMGG